MIGELCLTLVIAAASPAAFAQDRNDDVLVEPDALDPTVNTVAEKYRPVQRASPRVVERRSGGSAAATGGAVNPPRPVEGVGHCEQSDTLGLNCRSYPRFAFPDDEPEADEPAADLPERLTEGRILRAVREIKMPTLPATVQPGTRTLVNVPTILSTTPRTLSRTIDLLGHEITVEATATSYTWNHGDGTTQTTSRPGRPWPAKDVTHTYDKTADGVSIRLTTTWTVRYRIDDAGWTPLGETLSTTSAPVTLEVTEAAPVLTTP